MFEISQYSSIAQKIRFIVGNAPRYSSILIYVADLIGEVSQSVFSIIPIIKPTLH